MGWRWNIFSQGEEKHQSQPAAQLTTQSQVSQSELVVPSETTTSIHIPPPYVSQIPTTIDPISKATRRLPSPFTIQSSSDTNVAPGRLNLPFPSRLTLFSILSFSTGFLLGGSIGGPEAALRYRALNAHRLPTSTPGWYLYHKSKNYHTIIGGVKKGCATGLRTTAWGSLFLVVEEAFDQLKGERDFTSSIGAGLTMAGLFSAIHHWGDVFTAARTTRIAAVGGLGFGLLQDLLMWGRGETPPYVRWAKRRFGWKKGEQDEGNDQGYEQGGSQRLLDEGNQI